MALSIDNKLFALPQDTGILYKQVDSATAIDGVFVFSDGSNKFKYENGKGAYIARAGGILPGADRTAALQTIVNHADVKEIVFDAGDIIINGTLTVPNNKTLKFEGNGRLVGTGTISGGSIDASFQSNIFATTLTVNPSSVAYGKWSVKWFGATGNGITNDYVAIQKSIDTCIANPTIFTTVFLPNGNYICNTALLMERFSSGSYQFHTVFLEGETSWWGAGSQGTTLTFTNKLSFGIGVQLGKGTKISRLRINGPFVPPSASGYNWFSIDFTNFVQDGSLDTDTAVNAGIVIDPFSRTGSVPTNSYSGFSTNYTKDSTGSNGGSTGVIIEDVMIFNFVAGIVCSINGQTRNAEQCRYEKIQLGNMKVGFINSTDQEKMNVIEHVGAWSDVHTLFVGGHTYGASTPGVYNVKQVNIAGRVNRLFDIREGGYFSSHFDCVFSESMGSIGYYQSNMHPTISNSELGITYPQDAGSFPDAVIQGGGLTFNNCSIRYYGTSWPVYIDGSFIFNNCRFEEIPFCGDYINAFNTRQINFNDCFTPYGGFGFQSGTKFIQPNYIYNYAFGPYTVQNPVSATAGIVQTVEYNEDLPYALMYPSGTYAINAGTSRQVVLNVGAGNMKYFFLNHPICTIIGNKVLILGIITNINNGTNEITISYIPKQVVNGNYSLVVPFIKYSIDFVGDIVTGTNNIDNCEFGFYTPNAAQLVGKVIPIHVNQDSNYIAWTLVTGSSSATNVQVSTTFNVNVPNATFSVGKRKYYATVNSLYGLTGLFTRGSVFEEKTGYRTNTMGLKHAAEVVNSGYITNVAQGKTRKAYFRPSSQDGNSIIKVTTNNFVPSISYSTYEVDTTSGDININLPSYQDMVMFLTGYSRTIRIFKISNDSNKVIINQSSTFGAEPINGQSQYILDNQYEWIDIQFSIIDVDPSVSPNYYTINVVGRSDLNQRVKFNTNADTTKSVLADTLLTHISVKPVTDLTAFRVGTTPGGNEIIDDTFIAGAASTTFDVTMTFDVNSTLYFQGFGGVSTDVVIHKKVSK